MLQIGLWVDRGDHLQIHNDIHNTAFCSVISVIIIIFDARKSSSILMLTELYVTGRVTDHLLVIISYHHYVYALMISWAIVITFVGLCINYRPRLYQRFVILCFYCL